MGKQKTPDGGGRGVGRRNITSIRGKSQGIFDENRTPRPNVRLRLPTVYAIGYQNGRGFFVFGPRHGREPGARPASFASTLSRGPGALLANACLRKSVEGTHTKTDVVVPVVRIVVVAVGHPRVVLIVVPTAATPCKILLAISPAIPKHSQTYP